METWAWIIAGVAGFAVLLWLIRSRDKKRISGDMPDDRYPLF